jgi:hypothetical protein
MRRPIYNFAIDPALLQGLRQVKIRDGISESEQIRRGIRLWLAQKGVRMETDRKRGRTRKRA